jgi:putative oxidoreductase
MGNGTVTRPDSRAVLLLLARILLSGIFVFGAFGTIRSFSEGVGDLRAKHFPMAPWVLGAAVSLEIVGALSLISGFRPRLGASALVAFLVPVTLAYHNFWAYEGASQGSQAIHFLKNLAILGGLLAVIVGSSKPSVPCKEKNGRT